MGFLAAGLRDPGANLLICCQQGESRGPAVAAAAVLAAAAAPGTSTAPATVASVVTAVHALHPREQINPGFLVQLALYRDMLFREAGSPMHSLACARARLLRQACKRAERGGECGGFDAAEEVGQSYEEAESGGGDKRVCWLAGVCSQSLRGDVAGELSGAHLAELRARLTAQFQCWATAEAPVRSIAGYLGLAAPGKVEAAPIAGASPSAVTLPPPSLWLQCSNCRARLATDANLVQPLDAAAGRHGLGSAGSSAGAPAGASESPYVFCEIMDWMLPTDAPAAGRAAARTYTPAVALPQLRGGASAGASVAPSGERAVEGSGEELLQQPEEHFALPEEKLRCPCCDAKVGRYVWGGMWQYDPPAGTRAAKFALGGTKGGKAAIAHGHGKGGMGAPRGHTGALEFDRGNFVAPAFVLHRESVRIVPVAAAGTDPTRVGVLSAASVVLPLARGGASALGAGAGGAGRA